jgi:hypothetical protein
MIPMPSFQDRVVTAFHESGHAIGGLYSGLAVVEVTVIGDGDCDGVSRIPLPKENRRERLPDCVRMLLAGPVAERVWYGLHGFICEERWPGGAGDVERARRLVRCFYDAADAHKFLVGFGAPVTRFVEKHWAEIVAVAEALAARGTLSGAEIERIVR